MAEIYQQPFLNDLLKELLLNRKNNYQDNQSPDVDDYNTIKYENDKYDQNIKKIILKDGFKVLFRSGLKNILLFNIYPQYFYKQYVKPFAKIGLLYNILNDTESKKMLLKLCAYRIFGHKRVKLPRHNDAYWKMLQQIKQYVDQNSSLKIKFFDLVLKIFDMSALNYDLKVYATEPGCCCIFFQKQYELHRSGVICKAESGDYVIDAGACWGETTMYFANAVGESGKVFSFEFIPSNLEVTKTNIALNPHLQNRIQLIERPIWSESEEKLYYVDWGPGSRVTNDEKKYNYQGVCTTLSIDDLVERDKIKKIDFIKMDIEGSEYNALKGAEKTIRKFKPKLAISLYHSLDDFITIPQLLYSLNLDYTFYLDHHTIYQNKTVLFAIPK